MSREWKLMQSLSGFKGKDIFNPILTALLNTLQNRGGVFPPPPPNSLVFYPRKHKIWHVESAWYYLLISILKFMKF